MTKAEFLYQDRTTGQIKTCEGAYDGPVPAVVWQRLNRRFQKLEASGYFYPRDTMEVYQEAVLQLERSAANLPRLTQATPETYLTGVVRITLVNIHRRTVAPLRAEYRKVESMLNEREEKLRIEFEEGSMTAWDIAESLPAQPTAADRQGGSARAIDEICGALLDYRPSAGEPDPKEVVRAFRAYVAANGNFVEAAHLARIGKNRFYAEWPRWLALARRVGEKMNGSRH